MPFANTCESKDMFQEKINQDIKTAMLARDEVRLLVLRGLNAAIGNKIIEKRTKLSKTESDVAKLEEASKLNDEEIQDVIISEAKKRRESILEFGKGGRQDLVDKETKELEILQEYLPEQMSEEAVREIVKKAIAETGATNPKDMGKIMSKVMPQVKGKTDGSIVGKIAGELLKG